MKFSYFEVEGGNFGDDMNKWFWDEIFPQYREIAPDHTMFGIGSLLGTHLLSGDEKVMIMGSRGGYGSVPNLSSGLIEFGWVRGPMTAEKLGIRPTNGDY
jgi:succinoglycan biosynthesis protein ExoV